LTRVTFASLAPGKQLTSAGVVKGSVHPGQGKNASGRRSSDAV